MDLRLSFEHGAILDGLPGWREFFARPVDRADAALADPAGRRRSTPGPSRTRPASCGYLAVWERLVIE